MRYLFSRATGVFTFIAESAGEEQRLKEAIRRLKAGAKIHYCGCDKQPPTVVRFAIGGTPYWYTERLSENVTFRHERYRGSLRLNLRSALQSGQARLQDIRNAAWACGLIYRGQGRVNGHIALRLGHPVCPECGGPDYYSADPKHLLYRIFSPNRKVCPKCARGYDLERETAAGITKITSRGTATLINLRLD